MKPITGRNLPPRPRPLRRDVVGGRVPGVQGGDEGTSLVASPRCHVPVIDDETSRRYAAIHSYLRQEGTPVSPNDLWIAASAAQHGLRVVTLDGDFDRIPQVLVTQLEPPHAMRDWRAGR